MEGDDPSRQAAALREMDRHKRSHAEVFEAASLTEKAARVRSDAVTIEIGKLSESELKRRKQYNFVSHTSRDGTQDTIDTILLSRYGVDPPSVMDPLAWRERGNSAYLAIEMHTQT